MSPRQFGKVDVSTTWPPCPRCPHKHPSHAPCPPSGVWLVLALCPACKPEKQLYCRTHRDRHMPALPDAHHALPDAPPEQEEHRRRIGEQP